MSAPLTEAVFERAVAAVIDDMKQAESAWTEYVLKPMPAFRAHVTFRSNSGKQTWEAFFDFDALTGDFRSGVTPYLWAKSLDRFTRKMDKHLTEQRP